MENNSNERRQHKRHELACPITLFGRGGEVLAQASTSDLSQGGAYVTVARDIVEDAGDMNVAFAIPGTAADHQIEGFAANAKVLRQEPADDGVHVGLALQFTQQMYLPIDT
ncbi:MAG: PilZ domain-containing protein [Planctomycetes bacterium]|nr:PilZ domain-containing protein [Planctomycetota bacterium]